VTGVDDGPAAGQLRGPQTIVTLDSTPPVPGWPGADLVQVYRAGLQAGRRQAEARIAEAWDEVDATWRSVPHRSYEDRVAERVALFERCAAATAGALGRPDGWGYDGGPVDWETGIPLAPPCGGGR
jgi:hypothetical protein